MSDELGVTEGLVRIRIPVERSTGGPDHDTVWAEPLGSGRYRVESCPFLAYGLSRNDVIGAAAERGEEPVLEDIVEKSGNRTLRIALDPSTPVERSDIQALLGRLVDFGCTWEAARPSLVALDLPPEVDVARVVAHLEATKRDGVLLWEWADPRPC